MRRTETPKTIWIKFSMVVDIPDVVTYTNFDDHRLSGFWVAGSQISPSPIDFYRRPYNTLALPCERVIWYSITHSLFLSRLKNLPSLQILPIAALLFFYLNIYYVDSPDCLLLFLSISVF